MGVTAKKCHMIMSGNDCWNSVCCVFQLMPESRQRIGWRDIVEQRVPEQCCCDRKRSTADGWQFERRNPQTVRSGTAECWPVDQTGHVSDMDQRTEVACWRHAVAHTLKLPSSLDWAAACWIASMMWLLQHTQKPLSWKRRRTTRTVQLCVVDVHVWW